MSDEIAIAIWSYPTTTAANLRLSIEERMQRLAKAITTANEMVDQSRVRKDGFNFIFAAPEYYFSAKSDAGDRIPMSNEERLRLEEDLLRFSGRFKRAILFPGTLYYGKPLVRAATEPTRKFGVGGRRDVGKALGDRRQKLLSRFDSLMTESRWGNPGTAHQTISEGKTREGDGKISAGLKTLKTVLQDTGASPMIARNVALMLSDGRRLAKYDKQVDSWDANGATPDQLMFVPGTRDQCPTVDGMRFGVEICADHALSMLRRRNIDVDFHVVLSDFTDSAYNQATTKGGYMIHASTQPLMSYPYDSHMEKLRMPDSKVEYPEGTPLKLWHVPCPRRS